MKPCPAPKPHAKAFPPGRTEGVNFGIRLSLWDYLFRKSYIPQDQDGTYALGFEDIDEFPKGFLGQLTYGFTLGSKARATEE